MIKFRTGQTATEANQALKSSLQTIEKAKQCSVLWFEEINKRKLFRILGYASINQYAAQELGFSSSRTGDYLQLCRSFRELPKVKEKIQSGDLGYTSARVLIKVANKKNQDEWLDFALNNSRRDLEVEVKRAKQQATDEAVGQKSLIPVPPKRRPTAVVPVKVSLQMSPVQFARYEALWEQIRKQRHAPAGKVEALLEIMETYVGGEVKTAEKSSPRVDVRPPVQVHVHLCPECEKATMQTSKGELDLGKDEVERALCDCQVSRPNQRNTTSIPPSIRRLVFARARHQCQHQGCDHARYLEIHHVIPRSQGGSNDPDNCICLCSAHHALVHKHKIGQPIDRVKSPRAVYYFASPNTCSNITFLAASQDQAISKPTSAKTNTLTHNHPSRYTSTHTFSPGYK